MKQSFLLRLPSDQLKQLQEKAAETGESVNKFLGSIINKNLSGINNEDNKNELVEIIKSSSFSSKLEAIAIFGSVAKGLDTKNSDLDVLLVLSESSKINRALYRIWDEEIADKISKQISYGKEVSPHFVSMANNIENIHSLWLEVAISGIVIWKASPKIEYTIQNIRLAIAKGYFTRKETHGHPYWLRNMSEDQI